MVEYMEDMVEYILIWSFSQQDEPEVDMQLLSSIPTLDEFVSCVEQIDLLLDEAMEMRKEMLGNKLVATFRYSDTIAATNSSSSSGPPSATHTNVGLDGDLTEILCRITGRPTTFQVIPITGMGGIGKTTLARAVFQHPKTARRFDVCLWATVSQEYNVKEILQGLLPGKAKQDEPVGKLIEQVHKQLVGRRYLIILDDVWDEKVWDGVRNAFPKENNCSRIILTTRLSNVATYVISSSTELPHQMKLLDEEHSWGLLQEAVYGHGGVCPGELQNIGRAVSRSCKGLPLALVLIGGLLKFNKSRECWEEFARSTTAEAAANDESLLKVMSLSYTNLPPHLKACFLYLGFFPEDQEIPTKELVRLWCAEGFLKPRESKTMEEVAEECLEELVDRNLVLVKEKRYNGRIKTSSIHDVLRDLSLRQAQNEKFIHLHGSVKIDNVTYEEIIKDQRRVSSPMCYFDCNISCDSLVRSFRTESYIDYDQLSNCFKHFKLLRVLERVEINIYNPSFRVLSSLTNLRYLHLEKGYGDEPIMVPQSISKLRNLETLTVGRCHNLKIGSVIRECQLVLPVEIWEMPRLRHLVSEVNMLLPPFPASDLNHSNIASSSLQTVTGVVDCDFTPSSIAKLQDLKKLKIKYPENSMDDVRKVFRLDNLVNLHHLEDLTITRDDYFSHRVKNIGFPVNLKKLRLRETHLPWEKMASIGDSLEHLEVLKLEYNSVVGNVWETIEGGFPQLKYLKMESLWQLEEWRTESTHFPSLEKLVIMECSRLKEVPAEIGEIDTLEKLTVKRDYRSDESAAPDFEESVQRIQEEQQSIGNLSLQVCILSKYKKISRIDDCLSGCKPSNV